MGVTGDTQIREFPLLGSCLTRNKRIQVKDRLYTGNKVQVYLWNAHEHEAADRSVASLNAPRTEEIKFLKSLWASLFYTLEPEVGN